MAQVAYGSSTGVATRPGGNVAYGGGATNPVTGQPSSARTLDLFLRLQAQGRPYNPTGVSGFFHNLGREAAQYVTAIPAAGVFLARGAAAYNPVTSLAGGIESAIWRRPGHITRFQARTTKDFIEAGKATARDVAANWGPAWTILKAGHQPWKADSGARINSAGHRLLGNIYRRPLTMGLDLAAGYSVLGRAPGVTARGARAALGRPSIATVPAAQRDFIDRLVWERTPQARERDPIIRDIPEDIITVQGGGRVTLDAGQGPLVQSRGLRSANPNTAAIQEYVDAWRDRLRPSIEQFGVWLSRGNIGAQRNIPITPLAKFERQQRRIGEQERLDAIDEARRVVEEDTRTYRRLTARMRRHPILGKLGRDQDSETALFLHITELINPRLGYSTGRANLQALIDYWKQGIEQAKTTGPNRPNAKDSAPVKTGKSEELVARFERLLDKPELLELDSLPPQLRQAVTEGKGLIQRGQRGLISAKLLTPETAAAAARRWQEQAFGGSRYVGGRIIDENDPNLVRATERVREAEAELRLIESEAPRREAYVAFRTAQKQAREAAAAARAGRLDRARTLLDESRATLRDLYDQATGPTLPSRARGDARVLIPEETRPGTARDALRLADEYEARARDIAAALEPELSRAGRARRAEVDAPRDREGLLSGAAPDLERVAPIPESVEGRMAWLSERAAQMERQADTIERQVGPQLRKAAKEWGEARKEVYRPRIRGKDKTNLEWATAAERIEFAMDNIRGRLERGESTFPGAEELVRAYEQAQALRRMADDIRARAEAGREFGQTLDDAELAGLAQRAAELEGTAPFRGPGADLFTTDAIKAMIAEAKAKPGIKITPARAEAMAEALGYDVARIEAAVAVARESLAGLEKGSKAAKAQQKLIDWLEAAGEVSREYRLSFAPDDLRRELIAAGELRPDAPIRDPATFNRALDELDELSVKAAAIRKAIEDPQGAVPDIAVVFGEDLVPSRPEIARQLEQVMDELHRITVRPARETGARRRRSRLATLAAREREIRGETAPETPRPSRAQRDTERRFFGEGRPKQRGASETTLPVTSAGRGPDRVDAIESAIEKVRDRQRKGEGDTQANEALHDALERELLREAPPDLDAPAVTHPAVARSDVNDPPKAVWEDKARLSPREQALENIAEGEYQKRVASERLMDQDEVGAINERLAQAAYELGIARASFWGTPKDATQAHKALIAAREARKQAREDARVYWTTPRHVDAANAQIPRSPQMNEALAAIERAEQRIIDTLDDTELAPGARARIVERNEQIIERLRIKLEELENLEAVRLYGEFEGTPGAYWPGMPLKGQRPRQPLTILKRQNRKTPQETKRDKGVLFPYANIEISHRVPQVVEYRGVLAEQHASLLLEITESSAVRHADDVLDERGAIVARAGDPVRFGRNTVAALAEGGEGVFSAIHMPSLRKSLAKWQDQADGDWGDKSILQHAFADLEDFTKAKDFDGALAARKWRADDVVLIPKARLDAFLDVAGQRADGFLNIYDNALGLWKAGVLVFTPRWYVYNLVGNMMQYGLLSGGDVRSILDASGVLRRWHPTEAGRARAARRYEAAVRSTPEDVAGASLAFEPGIAEAQSRLPKIAQRLFEFNKGLEGFLRRAAYLNSLKRQQRMAGLSEPFRAQFLARAERKDARAESWVQAIENAPAPLREAAVREALLFMGDYRRFNRFERTVVRRLVPFWSWIRVISRLTFSLPFKSPLRAEALSLLGQMAWNDLEPWEQAVEQMRPFFARGGIKIPTPFGEYTLRTNTLNPFATVLDSPLSIELLSQAAEPEEALRTFARGTIRSAAPGIGPIIEATIPGAQTFIDRPVSAPPGYDDLLTRYGRDPVRWNPTTGRFESVGGAQVNVFENLAREAFPFPYNVLRSGFQGTDRPYDTATGIDIIRYRLGLGGSSGQLFRPDYPSGEQITTRVGPGGVGSTFGGLFGLPIESRNLEAELDAIEAMIENAQAAEEQTRKRAEPDESRTPGPRVRYGGGP